MIAPLIARPECNRTISRDRWSKNKHLALLKLRQKVAHIIARDSFQCPRELCDLCGLGVTSLSYEIKSFAPPKTFMRYPWRWSTD